MFVPHCDKKILFYTSFIMLLFGHNVESRNWLDCPGPGCPAKELAVEPVLESNRNVGTDQKANVQVCNQSGAGINYSVNHEQSYLWHSKCEFWQIQGQASLSLEQPRHRTKHLKSTYSIKAGNYIFIAAEQNQSTAEETINIILKPVKQ